MKPAKLAVPGSFLLALLLLPALGPRADAQWNPLNPVTNVEQQDDGVRFAMKTGALKIEVASDAMVHVLYSPSGSFPERQDYVVLRHHWPADRWTVQSTAKPATRQVLQGSSCPSATICTAVGGYNGPALPSEMPLAEQRQ